MGKTGALGAFEELVLLALLRLGETAYSVSVRREIEDRTGSEISMGAVYATLDRLEEKGYASSRLGDGSRSGSGRPRRFYAVEEEGREALARSREVRGRMWDGVEPFPAPERGGGS
ncbi:MAG TPA: helix-turn-helix transcriptional regulator [Longimicrobiales bacterium]|nr:helix-turn-helix transcriptional regulator [Longimicrobiales bacterium]